MESNSKTTYHEFSVKPPPSLFDPGQISDPKDACEAKLAALFLRSSVGG
jgi:hypothetical protein